MLCDEVLGGKQGKGALGHKGRFISRRGDKCTGIILSSLNCVPSALPLSLSERVVRDFRCTGRGLSGETLSLCLNSRTNSTMLLKSCILFCMYDVFHDKSHLKDQERNQVVSILIVDFEANASGSKRLEES